ncbi:hypothetical protein HBI23_047610 [Parastagonospora nodorum]|nr:hypothetical protein HBI12_031090 [Parastagonospora nodorum]KAH5454418.1 hypothetical protein HBI47_013850 [Parastagonospora nodorum]KAH5686087.1 hypothetical protein HBI23_047610 [Parastagonospora nodorum]
MAATSSFCLKSIPRYRHLEQRLSGSGKSYGEHVVRTLAVMKDGSTWLILMVTHQSTGDTAKAHFISLNIMLRRHGNAGAK